MQKLMGLVRRCSDDYRMIEPNDKIAIGVSGGKDSVALLVLLAAMREYYPQPYELTAISIDMGFGMDFTPIAELCEKLNVPYHIVKTEIASIIFDYRQEKNPCSMCAKMRRGALNQALLEQGFTKVALGHHYDDAVETFLMSLIYEGRLSCFQPVTFLDRTGVTQIRPLLYLSEKTIANFVERENLPLVHNRCPADKRTKRQEIKDLIANLQATYPDLKTGSVWIVRKAKSEQKANAATKIETAFAAMYTHMVLPGIITLEKLIDLLANNPRKRFGIPLGEDYTVWNLEKEFTVDPDEFLSKGKATPFAGWKMKGVCEMTVCDGKVVYRR